ncbi:hypothetical protein [Prescottella subtropica]|uniref:hypothetical protein n=1 Tax=Prescottella subtropica TaxID=2545757 RepID=UPI0010F844E5|nr:hypothetical protein [Prescottella subtropica]
MTMLDTTGQDARRRAAKAQATHQVRLDTRSTCEDGMLVAVPGYTIAALHDRDEVVAFVPVHEWATPAEVCAELRAAGYTALGFGYVRAA